jgi:hypothetical protein
MPLAPADAVWFVEQHGIVLESAHGEVPNLAEWIAQENIRGSWWGHPKSHEIFGLLRAVRRAPDVLVCRLIDNKITFVHRRLWPALARVSHSVDASRLAIVEEIHTAQGKHVVRVTPFLDWVAPDVLSAGLELSETEALRALGLCSRTK